jgi:hypothetical protein
MTSKTEEWLYKKAKEVDSELELQDLYTSKFSFGGRWVMDLLEEYHKEQLTLTDVSQRSELLLDFLNVTSPSMSIDDKHAIINAYKRNKSNNCG